MRALAISLLGLGAAGCGLTVLSALGGFEFEVAGHQFGVTLTIDWRALFIAAPLFICGVALWFFTGRKSDGARQSSNP
jgi:hypothetical protein